MRKSSFIALASALIITLSGCGKQPSEQDINPDLQVEPITEETTAVTALATPTVNAGGTEPGEDQISVRFEWKPVEGADGYEVIEENKFYKEDTYREPEEEQKVDTSQTTYVTGAQDYFDFRIKVRAYRCEGDNREFSEWSEYAYGSTYDESDVAPIDDGAAADSLEKEADELFAKAIAGEIIVNATYEDGKDFSYYITDLPNDPEDFYSYTVGERVDLDNDGVKELIINGPYGGKYLDARDGKVYQLAEGEGTAGQLCYVNYNDKTYICHVDNSHGGREIFLMDQYNGNGAIVDSTSLTAEYWDYVEFNAEAAQCHFGDEEITVERYLELRNEIFGY
ncbi:hypothetical protein [Butyrivibrio sp. YAB3001]|uniref:hypothetical protein n=1 Tax=Butyrivibrio sp. YAB3001 TaxID=1520812 RepID=UPI0008F642A6|nr:hypothetical protein [Butyrivibrio sp. YAB3001]SFC47716.1 hypothetical protein SAMN02910398_02341 [Butyrivibrio sp. YAB3001]